MPEGMGMPEGMMPEGRQEGMPPGRTPEAAPGMMLVGRAATVDARMAAMAKDFILIVGESDWCLKKL
jgi:hypothetical protein